MSRDRTVSSSEEDHDPAEGRADPRCPSCGEKVGARAQYCIHCWRDLPEREGVHDYDDVTGASHEVSHERDAVTTETGEVSAGTPTVGDNDANLLERLRAATERRASSERPGSDAPPVPSGLGTDGPSFLPVPPSEWERAGVFLSGLAVVGLLALVVGEFGPVTAGALVAFVAWVGSTAWLGRARSWFDAMRYGSFNLMSTMIFAPFGLALAVDGAGLVPLALTLAPVAISTLLVAGLGDTVADYPPGEG